MKKLKFKKINAFASPTSAGNPAGMVYLDDSDTLTSADMLRIAQELKGFVSEVGYVSQSAADTFALKYYSSEREVDFCGHATIAIMYELIKNSRELINRDEIKILTNKGELTVENRIRQEDAVFISAPQPVFSAQQVGLEDIARSLRIAVAAIDASRPVTIVNAGLETLIVPIKNLSGILAISPDLEELKDFCVAHGVDIITVYTDDVVDMAHSLRTRVFAPTFGYLEDPATGSGNSALGYYLLENKIWDGALISIEQNGNAEQSNIVKIMAKATRGSGLQVFFGGGAIVKIDGKYIL